MTSSYPRVWVPGVFFFLHAFSLIKIHKYAFDKGHILELRVSELFY